MLLMFPAALSLAATIGMPRTDPATQLARVRLIVVSPAATTDITIAGATLASYTSVVLSSSGSASQTGGTMRATNNNPGTAVEVQFDVVLAGVTAASRVAWNVSTSQSVAASLEVFSTNDASAPQSVDRFAFTGTSAEFTTQGTRLLSGDDLTVGPVPEHLVLAHYYPWYDLASWRDPELADRPVQPYSSDDASAILRQTGQAHAAGIDAFVVSWQGREIGWNDQRMRLVLDAAQRTGLRACVYFETYVANSGHDPSQPIDLGVLARWLEDAVDMYGSHPAYLRVDGRPVIFVYIASQLSEAQWSAVLASVRARGRNPLVIGDFFHSRLINVLDGEYQYINIPLSPEQLADNYRTESLRVRTFNLLKSGDRRRIWVASVTPGYDDRLLSARTRHLVVERANGALYDAQWRTAITLAADWVVISTWNEYFENTGVEPTERFGSAYLDATLRWAKEFKTPDRAPHR